MFLEEFARKNIKSLKDEMTLNPSFVYWRNTLLEYCMRLFTWENLPETIPQHEIELRCFLRGYCGLVKLANGEWVCADVNMTGITDYYDIFTDVNFATPLHYGKRKIDKTAVLVKNTSLYNPLIPKINRTALLLAHADISIVCEFVNSRNVGVAEVISDNQAQGMQKQRESQYNGFPDIIVNKGFATVRTPDPTKRSQGEVEKLLTAKNNILASFLEEIGIKKSVAKKERLVTDEVEADDEMLHLNISDMLENRQKSAKKFSELIGREVTVKCNIEYETKGVDLGETE